MKYFERVQIKILKKFLDRNNLVNKNQQIKIINRKFLHDFKKKIFEFKINVKERKSINYGVQEKIFCNFEFQRKPQFWYL